MTLLTLACILLALTLISVVIKHDMQETFSEKPVLITNYSRKTLIDGSVSNPPVLWRSVINGEKRYWEPTVDELIEDQMDRGI